MLPCYSWVLNDVGPFVGGVNLSLADYKDRP